MGLLSRKPKVVMEEFCRNLYDSQVFKPIIGGVDASSVYCETIFNSVVEADKSFKLIDFKKFQEELTALRMELFGLAWMEKFKSEQYTIPQSFFTQFYLQEINKTQIWDIMGEYNQAIAMSATMTETGGQIGEVGGRIGRVKETNINVSRANMFDRWCDACISNRSSLTEEDRDHLTCVARVANRIGVDIRRADCITVRVLTARLADRLGCDVSLNSEALFRLSAIIFGLHQGAKEAMKDVDIQI